MHKKNQIALISFALIIFVSPVNAQIMPERVSAEDLGKTVVYLQSGGTGFLLGHNNRIYIVTAKHVAEHSFIDGQVVMNTLEGNSVTISFAKIRGKMEGAKWFFHSNADVAIHPIDIQPNVAHIFYPSDAMPKGLKVSLLSSVYILGFPKEQGVNEHLSPIAKKARVASEPINVKYGERDPEEVRRFLRNVKLILLDEALSQGYSGAPVFCIMDVMTSNTRPSFKVGERFMLCGIQSLAISDKTGGKLSVVVPTNYIWDVLQSPDFLKYETNLTRSKK